MPLVYEELRQLAVRRLSQERPGQTLQATALVHEAYLRMVGQEETTCWTSRGHFLAAAAEAMRRILIDSARRKKRLKRGGDLRRHDVSKNEPAVEGFHPDVVAVDEALSQLALEHPEKAELVKLRYFGGLTLAEAACALAYPPQLPIGVGDTPVHGWPADYATGSRHPACDVVLFRIRQDFVM